MNRPRTASTRPDPAVSLGPWYRGVQSALRRAYFGRVRVAGTQPGPRRRSRLIVASHRNGALDGAIVLAAFPYAQHLVSLQLLRGPLRALFDGIPVIRAKDVERYGMDRSQITDPVTAGVTHLRDGGDLVVFPEGTSEWRHAPGTHQRGAAKIWCRLQEEGIDVDVIPVGLFYAAPERYGSTAQPWVGPVLELPRSTAGRRIEREKEAHRLITDALDAVSVDCPSPAVFDGVQRRAAARARAGESFAAAFLEEQEAAQGLAGGAAGTGPSAAGATAAGNPVAEAAVPAGETGHGPFASEAPVRSGASVAGATAAGNPAAEAPVPSPWTRRLGLLLHWPVWPVLGVAHVVGRKADARNTVSFFRVLGGAGATAVWGAVLLGAGVAGIATGHGGATAVTAAAGTASLVAGRILVTARRWQPDTAPLTDPPVHHRPASR